MSDLANRSFIDLALSGDALLFEIDDFIAAWHNSQGEQSLHDFLGFTQPEYALWLAEPDMLAHIVRARRDKLDLNQLIESAINDNIAPEGARVAARASDVANVSSLKRWLQRQGVDLS